LKTSPQEASRDIAAFLMAHSGGVWLQAPPFGVWPSKLGFYLVLRAENEGKAEQKRFV
jgi:hypothetical protein